MAYIDLQDFIRQLDEKVKGSPYTVLINAMGTYERMSMALGVEKPVITREPETYIQNMGRYRLQVYDKNTTGIYWHLHKYGREKYDKYKKTGGGMGIDAAKKWSGEGHTGERPDDIGMTGDIKEYVAGR